MPQLFLIPTSLNPEIAAPAILTEQLQQIQHLQHFIVETAKIGRAHLKQLQLRMPIQELTILELNKHKHDYQALVQALEDGHDVGLLSDCGCPAVADPGNRVVSIAHALGHTISPLVGPSSILLTLMASGLNGQKFTFHGYLPAEPAARKIRIKQLEQEILKENSTHIFIEAPFRNQKLLEALISTLNPELKLCVGINLMTAQQQIISKSINEWQQQRLHLDKQEVIFLIGS